MIAPKPIFLLVWLAAIATACLPQPPAGETPVKPVVTTNAPVAAIQSYAVKGEVKELKIDGKTVVIKHEEIPGYMAAMTMPFEVRDPKELAGLQAGDKVTFRLQVTDTDGWIDHVTKVGRVTTMELPSRTNTFRQVRDVDPLSEGDLMPNYNFTNQLGQAVSLGEFKGQAVAFTFIFTRCPFPVYCPRMSENFSAAYKKMIARPGGETNWHLLSISFDPAFDTPAVLKRYATRYQYDPARWSFVSGALIELDAITEQFGLSFTRDESGINFNHNLRTVVVDAAGRIQKILIGNEWKPDELVEELVKAAAAK